MRARAANLLGALAIGLTDRLQRETEAAAGRTGGRAAALATLAQWPGDTIEELSHTLGLTHSATVRVIDGLVADGFATREHLGGGPAVRPRLTEAGEAQARRVLAARGGVLQWLVSDLSDEELTQLAPAVELLLQRLTTDFNAGEVICRLCELGVCPQDRCPVECRQRQLVGQ
jgi:MarR family transcriptional repressor of emrRAB